VNLLFKGVSIAADFGRHLWLCSLWCLVYGAQIRGDPEISTYSNQAAAVIVRSEAMPL
jgi:type IV secretory pathway TrbD component